MDFVLRFRFTSWKVDERQQQQKNKASDKKKSNGKPLEIQSYQPKWPHLQSIHYRLPHTLLLYGAVWPFRIGKPHGGSSHYC